MRQAGEPEIFWFAGELLDYLGFFGSWGGFLGECGVRVKISLAEDTIRAAVFPMDARAVKNDLLRPGRKYFPLRDDGLPRGRSQVPSMTGKVWKNDESSYE